MIAEVEVLVWIRLPFGVCFQGAEWCEAGERECGGHSSTVVILPASGCCHGLPASSTHHHQSGAAEKSGKSQTKVILSWNTA